MARRQRLGGRTTPKGTRPLGRSRPPQDDEWDEPDLLRDVRERLATGQPLDLLAEVSSLAAATDVRLRAPAYMMQRIEPGPSLEDLIGSFEQVDRLETTAMLAGLSELAPEELQRRRAGRIVAGRRHPLPTWLARLGDAVAYQVVEMVHELGDGDNVMIGIRFADGQELTVVAYIDHNLGTVVKDAFVVPGPLDDLVAAMRRLHDDPEGTEWRPADPANARAKVIAAVDLGARFLPPFETETWPMCRPVVEWATRLLPEGGHGYARPEWRDAERRALTDNFFASPFARGLGRRKHRQLFESFLWFGCDYGPGDPLRWSPVAVEMLLADWIPRKIVADSDFLAPAPDLLRAFVRYAHHLRGVRSRWTAETLAAIDEWEPDYQHLIRTPRPQGPEAVVSAMREMDPDGGWDVGPSNDALWDDDSRWGEDDEDAFPSYLDIMLARLRSDVGGADALDALDAAPLPNEDFVWTGIPDDIHGKVGEVLAAVDECCARLLDDEYRTACRRFLARAAAGDPQVFRRKARTDTAAAAVVWSVGKGNELFSPNGGGMLVKDLAQHFGLSASASVSQRAATLLRAAGIASEFHYVAWDVSLGTPDLLVSRRRRRIIDLRHRYVEMSDF